MATAEDEINSQQPNPLGSFRAATAGMDFSQMGQDFGGLQPEDGEFEQQTRRPITTQLHMSEREINALATWIDESFRRALADHYVRQRRCAHQEKLWREKVGLAGGDEGNSNFRVPLTTALIMAKHAREVDAFFGSDPGVNARPRGPGNAKQAKRISLAMKWQVYENMQSQKPIALWLLRRLKHGRSFIHCPWIKKFYNKTTIDPITRQRRTERVLYHQGPDPQPLGNDELVLPASVEGKTGFDSAQTAHWVCRRYWDTPGNMLRNSHAPGDELSDEGEEDWYQGVAEHWKDIMSYARQGLERDSEKDPSFIVSDRSEGVLRDSSTTMQREELEIYEFHMKWRRFYEPEEQQDEFESEGFERQTESAPATVPGRHTGLSESDLPVGVFRDTDGILKYQEETDLIVRYAQRLRVICGIQDAAEVYPDSPFKRPIFETSLLNDGQYWNMGLVELTEELERELCVLANRVIQAVEMSIGAPILAEPSIGEGAFRRKYESFDVIWVANVAAAKQLQVNPNVEPFATLWQMFSTIQEQLTGITNQVMGRGLEQPNAPRTLGGQRLIAGASDVRLALDMRNLGEDMRPFLRWIFDLWRMFGNEQQFYRVADGDSQGLFETGELQDGWASLSPKEMHGEYDFSLVFADDAQVREGRKQEMMALSQILHGFPSVLQNPVMIYRFLVDVFEAFNLKFSDYSPEPPPPFSAQTPEAEWQALLRGEDANVHPEDNDAGHIKDHEQRILAMGQAPAEDQNHPAMLKALHHIEQHKQSMVSKQQMAELAQLFQGVMQMAGGAQAQNPLAALFGGVGQPEQQQLPAPKQRAPRRRQPRIQA